MLKPAQNPIAQKDLAIIDAAESAAKRSGFFGHITRSSGRLTCAAANSAAPAEYRLERANDGWWVSLVTADRWLSQSIEADLVHTGDKLEELLEEELSELGAAITRLRIDHFRSDDKLFTFRSPLPEHADGDLAAKALLAYEQCFRYLGDMQAGED